MYMNDKRLSANYLYKVKSKKKKTSYYFMLVILLLTLLQYCEINHEYQNHFIRTYVLFGTIIANMLYAFILCCDNVCLEEKRSGRVTWYLANGILPEKIVCWMTKSEFTAMVVVEALYLSLIFLLSFIRVISISFISSETMIVFVMIHILFYQFINFLNVVLLIAKKPENVKFILLMSFFCLFFMIYLPVYFFSALNVSSFHITALCIVFVLLLLLLRKIKIYMIHHKFHEKVMLSFKE